MLACLALGALAALVVLVAWPWRVEATLKAVTHESAISLAGGLEVAGLSGSAAAILGGPGVVAVHLRARELWRRSIQEVTIDALLEWLAKPSKAEEPSAVGRLVKRAKEALLARTDQAALPKLGLQVLSCLRDVSLEGKLLCGFENPALTGKTAAWLYPTAAVLSPFGTFDVSFDWSGRSVVDGALDASFRIVPAHVVFEAARFARRHVHLRRKSVTVSSTLPTASSPT